VNVSTGHGSERSARWRLASDSYDPSLPAGYSSHADWFNGWKPEFVESFVKGCDRPAKDCHAAPARQRQGCSRRAQRPALPALQPDAFICRAP
jgi:hypothetical protein